MILREIDEALGQPAISEPSASVTTSTASLPMVPSITTATDSATATTTATTPLANTPTTSFIPGGSQTEAHEI